MAVGEKMVGIVGAIMPFLTGSAPGPIAEAVAVIRAGDRSAGVKLLRAFPLGAASRSEAVAATLAASAADPEFQTIVRDADTARDMRDFALAEYLYWRCLRLYPLHYGYLTQYAHCLKEQGKWEDAEAIYRSALALGGPADDLERHIAVAARGYVSDLPDLAATMATEALDLPPTRDDLFLLLALLLRRGPASPAETLALLRTCRTRRELVLALIKRDEFVRANRDLMALLAEAA